MLRLGQWLVLVASCGRHAVESPSALSEDEVRGLLRAGLSIPAVAADMSVAKSADLASLPAARRRNDAALARVLQNECTRNNRTPISASELIELTRQHWREVDVDERVKVVHVVALRSKLADVEAKRAIESIREKIGDATDLAAFDRIAAPAARDSKGALVYQLLDTFTTDGRTTEGESNTFDRAFVDAAFALKSETPLSPAFQTKHGWHLALLLNRTPARRVPEAERRKLFEPEAQAARARTCVSSLLARLRNETRVDFAPGFAGEIDKIKQSD